MSDSGWYILKISGGRELKIKDALEVELKKSGVDHFVGNILVPSREVFALKAGKRIKKQHVFLPGYLFIEVIKFTVMVRECLRSVPGIFGFLSNKSWGWNIEPQIMIKSDVDKIIGANAVDNYSSEKVTFFLEDSVKIVDGPFKGLVGVVRENSQEKCRLCLDVNIFDRSVSVELSYSQIEKI